MIKQLSYEDLNGEFFDMIEKFLVATKMIFDYKREYFLTSWKTFYSMGIGTIFALYDDKTGKITGALGAAKFPDVNSGTHVASELFWFVEKESRGKGLLLLKAFEKWAKERDCKRIVIMHLADLMPEKLKKVYEHRGYIPAEIAYTKEV